jgi:hypothetical protein
MFSAYVNLSQDVTENRNYHLYRSKNLRNIIDDAFHAKKEIIENDSEQKVGVRNRILPPGRSGVETLKAIDQCLRSSETDQSRLASKGACHGDPFQKEPCANPRPIILALLVHGRFIYYTGHTRSSRDVDTLA